MGKLFDRNSIIAEHIKNEADKIGLDLYTQFLEDLYSSTSEESFLCGGLRHTSLLMSYLFKKTKVARVYCCMFEPDLTVIGDYWDSLIDYVNNTDNILFLLCDDCDYVDYDILKNLNNNSRVKIRINNEEGKKLMIERFGEDPCSFAVFDDHKFRFEYDPILFKAYASFNQPEKCRLLSNLFDSVFNIAKPL